jgi:hypothetical protein
MGSDPNDPDEMTAAEAERAHLRGPAGRPEPGVHRMQDLRKIGREYQFICPVCNRPHRGSPAGQDPADDPGFAASHDLDDGAHFLG